MNKLLSAVLLIVSISTASFAQGVSFGIKAGVNFANQSYEDSNFSLSPNGRTGFHGGVYLTGMLTDNFGIQPEIYYSMQGSEINILSTNTKVNVDYLSVPVLLRYNITDFFNLHVGPQFGFVMKAETKTGNTTADFKDDIKSADIGGAFGAGVDLPFGLNGGVRYVLGFSNISNDDSSDDTKIKNKMFQIYLGYRLFGAGNSK